MRSYRIPHLLLLLSHILTGSSPWHFQKTHLLSYGNSLRRKDSRQPVSYNRLTKPYRTPLHFANDLLLLTWGHLIMAKNHSHICPSVLFNAPPLLIRIFCLILSSPLNTSFCSTFSQSCSLRITSLFLSCPVTFKRLRSKLYIASLPPPFSSWRQWDQGSGEKKEEPA